MPSIFTRIIAGEIPGRLVWDDDVCIAMIDIRPLHTGHALVIPKVEVDHWIDLDADTASHLMSVARHIGLAQRQAFTCERIALVIAGFEVPHAHLHVSPADTMADLDFRNADPSVAAAELDRVAAALRRALIDLGHGAHVPAATD